MAILSIGRYERTVRRREPNQAIMGLQSDPSVERTSKTDPFSFLLGFRAAGIDAPRREKGSANNSALATTVSTQGTRNKSHPHGLNTGRTEQPLKKSRKAKSSPSHRGDCAGLTQ